MPVSSSKSSLAYLSLQVGRAYYTCLALQKRQHNDVAYYLCTDIISQFDVLPPVCGDHSVPCKKLIHKIKYSSSFKRNIPTERKRLISQSTVEDNNDVPDLPEWITNIIQINLSVEEVKNTLTELGTTKITGPDQTHNLILKTKAWIISEPVTFLFNRSLNEGIFPTVWKTAHATPVHKKGNKELCTNYRPMSLLSCIGKTLDCFFHRHVFNNLNANQMITQSQSWCTPKHSTVHKLLSIYDDFCKSFQ